MNYGNLSVAEVLLGLLNPLALLAIGYFLNRRLREFEANARLSQRLSDVRLGLYKDIGFQLNDIYAYFTHVGLWKTLGVAEILERKRVLDRNVYTYRPLLGPRFFARYKAFIDATFATYGAMGTDARLRTSADHRPEAGVADTAGAFTGEDNRDAVAEAYRALMDSLADNLGFNIAENS